MCVKIPAIKIIIYTFYWSDEDKHLELELDKKIVKLWVYLFIFFT